jgi:hypothetical protein
VDDNGGAVLVVMKDRNFHPFACRRRSISKHSGALMSSRLMPPKVGSSAAIISTSLSDVGFIDFDIDRIDVREFFEQDGFAFHHRFGGERADIAEAENGGAVGNDGNEVAAWRCSRKRL